MRLLEYARVIARRDVHLDYATYALLAIVSPVTPDIPMGDDTQWCNLNLLYIGDIGIGKSSLLERIAKIAPIAVYADKLTEGSIIGLYNPGAKDISFPLIEASYNGIIISTEFDKIMQNKRLQGLMRRILERYPVQAWSRGYTRTIIPNSALLACANPRGDIVRSAKLIDIIVFELGLLNRFDYIKIQKLSKEELVKLAEEIGIVAWTITPEPLVKLQEIANYVAQVHQYLLDNHDQVKIQVPHEYVKELVKIFKEKANPEENPLENIRVLISSLKVLQCSVSFHLYERMIQNDPPILKATEEDLELAKMHLVTHLENIKNLMKILEKTALREARASRIMRLYGLIKRLCEETGTPVKLSEIIKEAEKQGIGSENTIRRYVRVLAENGMIVLEMYKTVYYVRLPKQPTIQQVMAQAQQAQAQTQTT